MNWRHIIVVVLVVLVGGAATAAAQEAGRRSDEQVLIQLEKDWDAAFLHNDVRFIETVLADDFIATYSDGTRGDRAKELLLAAQFNQKVDSSTLDDFTVKIFGEAALVLFTRHLSGPSQGRQLEVTYRYIDVFVRRASRWLCVASQSVLVTK
jgi:ketosteroid isomerase-like protein